MSKQRKDATIVTTLTITHVLQGACGGSEEELMGLAQDLARVAKDAMQTAYVEHCLPAGQPDDISVSGVQVFLHDEQSALRENNAQRSERAEGSAE